MTTPSELENVAQPEKQSQPVEDNARKFRVEPLDPEFLEKAKSSFLLTVDWFEVGEENEVKLAKKTYQDGTVKTYLVSKITKDGSRETVRKEITDENEYLKLLEGSVCHLEKMRYEFDYEQNGIVFDVKYDAFTNSDLRMLEVDADSEAERNFFELSDFPSDLTEVTGEMQYYGYRVASIV